MGPIKNLKACAARVDSKNNAQEPVIQLAGDRGRRGRNLRIDSARDLADDSVKRVALADPKAVSAGVYAKEYLEKLKLSGSSSVNSADVR